MRAYAATTALIFAALLSATGQACEGRTTLLDETFVNRTNGWQIYPNVGLGDGNLTITLSDHHERTWLLNTAIRVQDADICLTGSFPGAFRGDVAIGVVFWSTDDGSLFLAKLGSDGVATLQKRAGGTFEAVWSQPAPTLSKAAGATNIIRVVTRGDQISVYVNGLRIRDAKAQHPTHEAQFGVYVEAASVNEGRAARAFRFEAVKVTSVD